MKQLTLFLALLIILSSLARAEEGRELTAMVTKISVPNKTKSPSKDTICFSNEWYQFDFLSSNLLKKINSEDRQALVNYYEGSTCYNGNRLSIEGKTRLIQLLNRIDHLSQSRITVPVEMPENESPAHLATSSISQIEVNDKESSLLRNQDASTTKKLLRGTAIIQGAQVLGLGVLMIVPSEISNWDSPISPQAGKNIRDAWTKAPVWDKDRWEINYIGHPVAGSWYYNAVRSQGVKPLTSFLFSTAQSLIWEYGFEAINERPSIQDILFTSTIGSVYGELAHRATLNMSQGGFSTVEKIVVTIINPMFVLNNGYKKKNL